MTPIMVDSSTILGAVLDSGLSRKVARVLATSSALLVSRLALVETSRALQRAHNENRITMAGLMRAQGAVEEFWARCEIWELTRAICQEARTMAPHSAFRTQDALHLATLLAVRKRLPSVKLLTADVRMAEVATSLGLKLVET